MPLGGKDRLAVFEGHRDRLVEIGTLAGCDRRFQRCAVGIGVGGDEDEPDIRMACGLGEVGEDRDPVSDALPLIDRVEVLGSIACPIRQDVMDADDAKAGLGGDFGHARADEIDAALARTDDGDTDRALLVAFARHSSPRPELFQGATLCEYNCRYNTACTHCASRADDAAMVGVADGEVVGLRRALTPGDAVADHRLEHVELLGVGIADDVEAAEVF